MIGRYDVVILGLSVTSSWGNGHATTYRSLIRAMAARGLQVLFLERNAPWYAENRDEPHPAGAHTEIYESLDDLFARFEGEVSKARFVIVGSFVPDGTRIGEWVLAVASGTTAFYDIDTPVTMANLAAGSREYISPELIARYHLYLSFTGGPLLRHIERQYGSPMARPLYCSVDPEQYRPFQAPYRWDLGYLGTYSDDRQPILEELMLEPARRWKEGRFMVAGPMYPESISWPANVDREIHLSPREHPEFYGSQRFTLNVTRSAMKAAGYSPSVRLFEAGACAAPIISDWWDGLDTILEPETEILIASSSEDTLRFLRDWPDEKRRALGEAARQRILAEHTPAHRAFQLEGYWREANDHSFAHSSRRYRRSRQSAGRIGAGMASQLARQATGGEARGTVGPRSDQSDLHEPSGAGR
jgi:spore maturation protein CgeB